MAGRARRADETTRHPGRAGRAGAAAPHGPQHNREDGVVVNAATNLVTETTLSAIA